MDILEEEEKEDPNLFSPYYINTPSNFNDNDIREKKIKTI
jgi:hypothetical protein